MHIPELESQNKRDDDPQIPAPDRAVRQISERYALTIPVATTIANLAGLGGNDADRVQR
jgi:hypothetical protein